MRAIETLLVEGLLQPSTPAPWKSMTPYDLWIAGFLGAVEEPHGLCEEATEAMIKTFPELTRVAGDVWDPEKGPTTAEPHWWCQTAEGEIVDPTRAQFSWKRITYHAVNHETSEWRSRYGLLRSRPRGRGEERNGG